MGFSANRMVRLLSLSRDVITKCMHLLVVGLRLEGNLVSELLLEGLSPTVYGKQLTVAFIRDFTRQIPMQ